MDKLELRERVWTRLKEEGVARFPFPVQGRIPNFAGADEAARRLADLREWREAGAIKANPDSPQTAVRRTALRQGKVVHMAVPRLRDAKCFLRLDPADMTQDERERAATIKGANALGEPVGPEAVEPIDLIVAGSVAVTADGVRVGKGEGYSDLEYAVLAELGVVDAETPVCTTVHGIQVVDGDEGNAGARAGARAGADVPIAAHDVPLDIIATPKRVIRTETPHGRPDGIDWDLLTEERIQAMPVLGWLRDR